MNDICDKMGEASPEDLEAYMEELGTIQDLLTMHDFYMIDSKVEEVARALGLVDIGLDRDVTELSGGQRTKVLLGKLLLSKPDILLLDEPTNYLDAEHIAWLKRYLQEYENAFILISHDIPFLNSVVNLIYHMDNQELNRYVGDYDKFQEVYAMKKAQLEAAYKFPPEIWPCPARKSWIRWTSLSLRRKNPSRNFSLRRQEHRDGLFLKPVSLSSATIPLFPAP